ncbi:hypothetical protein EYF80_049002 [Liparis tanakae]|uniref:Uncharacterized protein n=1 Tax=Liparis tanakae TaxID=230148 RepID=A0A4Z2FI46_9TELE|nr:hypothetical protein EYF80_049002 [Liparis tanakae]
MMSSCVSVAWGGGASVGVLRGWLTMQRVPGRPVALMSPRPRGTRTHSPGVRFFADLNKQWQPCLAAGLIRLGLSHARTGAV